MNEILNNLIVYYQIHKMFRNGWSISRLSEFLGTNWRTTKKYFKMSEDEVLAFQESQGN